MLLTFSSWDLKDSNNTLYQAGDSAARSDWYVVRDLGGALGQTTGITPRRNNIDLFERERFIKGLDGDYVSFAYQGKRRELVHHTISVDDLDWAVSLLSGLNDRQWHDAFRAGGYSPAAADRFIRKIQGNLTEARRLIEGTRSAPLAAR
jgi:hypothetical protein